MPFSVNRDLFFRGVRFGVTYDNFDNVSFITNFILFDTLDCKIY